MAEVKHTPFVIDARSATIAKFPDEQVILDASNNVAALCPFYAEPWVEGQFSYAAKIQRAVNCHDDLLAALKALLPSIDAEVEQRQTSGLDEYWSDLKALSDAGHAAIAKAEVRS